MIAEEKLLDNVKARGEQLRASLREHYGAHPHIGDVRGRGLFVGVETVRDRDSKATFDPALKLHAAVKREAMQRGLMVYPMGGTIDGVHGDHILARRRSFAPRGRSIRSSSGCRARSVRRSRRPAHDRICRTLSGLRHDQQIASVRSRIGHR